VEEMKNLDQMQQPIEELLWLVHDAKLWACVVNSKKQTSRGLKKITHTKWYMHKQSKMNQNDNENTNTSQ
jgi:hypothetical protein